MTGNQERRFIDLHVLQTLPYANLNRDDLGTPKRVVYGGVERTRVSSQSWKRATRLAIDAQLDDPALRTRRVITEVAERLHGRGWERDLAVFAGQQLLGAVGEKEGLKLEEDGVTSSVLLYLPASTLNGLADLADEHREPLEEAHAAAQQAKASGKASGKAKKRTLAVPADKVTALLTARNGTIALFGRMLAELPGGQVDGAVSVAHAFTTHATDIEVDFFAAVDDLLPPEQTGSGHISDAEFSAGVFYRYTTIAIHDLEQTLGGDQAKTRELATAYLHAFLAALPTGKQRSTAPNTIPDLAYIAVRTDRPISLAAAFESPVRAQEEGGWSAPSRRDLATYADELHRLWGTDGLRHHARAGFDSAKLDGLGDPVPSYNALISAAADAAFGAAPEA